MIVSLWKHVHETCLPKHVGIGIVPKLKPKNKSAVILYSPSNCSKSA